MSISVQFSQEQQSGFVKTTLIEFWKAHKIIARIITYRVYVKCKLIIKKNKMKQWVCIDHNIDDSIYQETRSHQFPEFYKKSYNSKIIAA